MKKSIDLSLVLPCFNEEGLFIDSLARIREVLDRTKYRYEIIFVDDASRDGTKELIVQAVRTDTRLRAVYHPVNKGRGAAVVAGIRAARGVVAGYIDIDCEVSPVYIPQMVDMILAKDADVVIGKRMYRTSAGSMIREVLSRGYRWLSDMLIGTGGMDTETGYKFFRRSKILPVVAYPHHDGWFWDTEIMVYAARAGLKIREVPVLFLRRFDKHSSVRIVGDTWDYLVHLFLFRRRLSGKNI